MPVDPGPIRTRVIEGLTRVATKPAAITGETHIVRDLEIDSLAVMNLILVLEDEFDISMPLDRVADIVTVDDLVSTVASLAGESNQ
ncbi:MAG TPA: acyl carrier protein [Nevskiaceae bacterium]|nr:acyl carrier protein [Nevskiaceae bacterium]